jgi:TonB family protein
LAKFSLAADNRNKLVIPQGGFMSRNQSSVAPRKRSMRAIGWLRAATLAVVVCMAISAHAGDERPVKSRVAPVYPELAKRMRIAGVVKLEASVDPDGKVTAVKTLSGSRALAPAAEEAVSRWKYAPAAAPSTEEVAVNFALAQ